MGPEFYELKIFLKICNVCHERPKKKIEVYNKIKCLIEFYQI